MKKSVAFKELAFFPHSGVLRKVNRKLINLSYKQQQQKANLKVYNIFKRFLVTDECKM